MALPGAAIVLGEIGWNGTSAYDFSKSASSVFLGSTNS